MIMFPARAGVILTAADGTADTISLKRPGEEKSTITRDPETGLFRLNTTDKNGRVVDDRNISLGKGDNAIAHGISAHGQPGNYALNVDDVLGAAQSAGLEVKAQGDTIPEAEQPKGSAPQMRTATLGDADGNQVVITVDKSSGDILTSVNGGTPTVTPAGKSFGLHRQERTTQGGTNEQATGDAPGMGPGVSGARGMADTVVEMPQEEVGRGAAGTATATATAAAADTGAGTAMPGGGGETEAEARAATEALFKSQQAGAEGGGPRFSLSLDDAQTLKDLRERVQNGETLSEKDKGRLNNLQEQERQAAELKQSAGATAEQPQPKEAPNAEPSEVRQGQGRAEEVTPEAKPEQRSTAEDPAVALEKTRETLKQQYGPENVDRMEARGELIFVPTEAEARTLRGGLRAKLAITSFLSKKFGAAFDKLVSGGTVVVVPTQEEAKKILGDKYPGAIRGFYDDGGTSGVKRVIIVADSVRTANQVLGVFAHEFGAHLQELGFLKSDNFFRAMKASWVKRKMLYRDSQAFRDAVRRTRIDREKREKTESIPPPASTDTKALEEWERKHTVRDYEFMKNELDLKNENDKIALQEIAGYMAEFGDQSPLITRNMIAAVKRFAINHGFDGIVGPMTADDVAALAQGAIRKGGAYDARRTGTIDSGRASRVGVGFPVEFSTLYSRVAGGRESDAILGAIQAGYLGIRKGTGGTHQQVIDNNLVLESIALEGRNTGAFIDDILKVTDKKEHFDKGAESYVYLSKDRTNVIKLNDTHLSEGFQDFLARIAAHNQAFPKDKYRIIGFAENPDARTTVVLQQRFVDAQGRETSQDAIDAELRRREFSLVPGSRQGKETGTWVSKDGHIEIEDARPANVLTDRDGELHFIDTLIQDFRLANTSVEELFNTINSDGEAKFSLAEDRTTQKQSEESALRDIARKYPSDNPDVLFSLAKPEQKTQLSEIFHEISAKEFISLRNKSQRPEFLTPYTAEEMKGWRHFATDDGVGFTLTDKDDIIGVVNNSGRKGAGVNALVEAIAKGGKTLDCIDGRLADYYHKFGFTEINRVAWNDQYAPKGWNYEKYGRPDIVFFEYPEELSRNREDILRRFENNGGRQSERRTVGTESGSGEYATPNARTREGVGLAESGSAEGGTGTDRLDVKTTTEEPLFSRAEPHLTPPFVISAESNNPAADLAEQIGQAAIDANFLNSRPFLGLIKDLNRRLRKRKENDEFIRQLSATLLNERRIGNDIFGVLASQAGGKDMPVVKAAAKELTDWFVNHGDIATKEERRAMVDSLNETQLASAVKAAFLGRSAFEPKVSTAPPVSPKTDPISVQTAKSRIVAGEDRATVAATSGFSMGKNGTLTFTVTPEMVTVSEDAQFPIPGETTLGEILNDSPLITAFPILRGARVIANDGVPDVWNGEWPPTFIVPEQTDAATAATALSTAIQKSLQIPLDDIGRILTNGKITDSNIMTKPGVDVEAFREATGITVIRDDSAMDHVVSGESIDSNENVAPKVDRRGSVTRVLLGGTQTPLAAQYEVRPLSELIASHQPNNFFERNPNYPEGVQERDYTNDKNEQAKVIANSIAGYFDPAHIISTDASAQGGTPIIMPNGVVVSGNGRAMTLQMLGDNARQRYKDMLFDQAATFRLTPEQINAAGDFPVLVRVLTDTGDRTSGQLSRIFNTPLSNSQRTDIKGIGVARLISPESLQLIYEQLPEFNTLRKFFDDKSSQAAVNSLIQDGVIPQQMMSELVKQNAGGLMLTSDGKNHIEAALRGTIINDPHIMNLAKASHLQKIDRAIPSLVYLKSARENGWDLSEKIKGALQVINSAESHDMALQAYLNQQTLGDVRTPEGVAVQQFPGADLRKDAVVRTLATYLDEATSKEFAARAAVLANYARIAETARVQQGMFAVASIGPSQAFRNAFGKDVIAAGNEARLATEAENMLTTGEIVTHRTRTTIPDTAEVVLFSRREPLGMFNSASQPAALDPQDVAVIMAGLKGNVSSTIRVHYSPSSWRAQTGGDEAVRSFIAPDGYAHIRAYDTTLEEFRRGVINVAPFKSFADEAINAEKEALFREREGLSYFSLRREYNDRAKTIETIETPMDIGGSILFSRQFDEAQKNQRERNQRALEFVDHGEGEGPIRKKIRQFAYQSWIPIFLGRNYMPRFESSYTARNPLGTFGGTLFAGITTANKRLNRYLRNQVRMAELMKRLYPNHDFSLGYEAAVQGNPRHYVIYDVRKIAKELDLVTKEWGAKKIDNIILIKKILAEHRKWISDNYVEYVAPGIRASVNNLPKVLTRDIDMIDAHLSYNWDHRAYTIYTDRDSNYLDSVIRRLGQKDTATGDERYDALLRHFSGEDNPDLNDLTSDVFSNALNFCKEIQNRFGHLGGGEVSSDLFNISSLKKRRITSADLQKFMGLVTDPASVAIISAEEHQRIIARLNQNLESAKALVASGLGQVQGSRRFFESGQTIRSLGRGSALGAMEYMPNAVNQIKAIQNEINAMTMSNNDVILRTISAFKLGKTVLNLPLAVNNAWGNLTIAALNGRLWQMRSKHMRVMNDRFFTFVGTKDEAKISAYSQQILREMTATGLLASSPHAVDAEVMGRDGRRMYTMIARGISHMLPKTLGDELVWKIEAGQEIAQHFYENGDEWYKILSYIDAKETALLRLEVDGKNLTVEEKNQIAMHEAAEHTVAESAVYSANPKFVRYLTQPGTYRRLLVNDFVGHNLQMLRLRWTVWQSIFHDMGEIKRLAGNISPEASAYKKAIWGDLVRKSIGVGIAGAMDVAYVSGAALLPHLLWQLAGGGDEKDDKDFYSTSNILTLAFYGKGVPSPIFFGDSDRFTVWGYNDARNWATMAPTPDPQPTDDPKLLAGVKDIMGNFTPLGNPDGKTFMERILSLAHLRDPLSNKEISPEEAAKKLAMMAAPQSIYSVQQNFFGVDNKEPPPFIIGILNMLGMRITKSDVRDITSKYAYENRKKDIVSAKTKILGANSPEALRRVVSGMCADVDEFDKQDKFAVRNLKKRLTNDELVKYLTKDFNTGRETGISEKMARAMVDGKNVQRAKVVAAIRHYAKEIEAKFPGQSEQLIRLAQQGATK